MTCNNTFFNKIKRYYLLVKLFYVYSRTEVVVWDLDGTLYFSPQMILELRKRYITYYKNECNGSSRTFKLLERRGYDWVEIVNASKTRKAADIYKNVESNFSKWNYVRKNLKLSSFLSKSSKRNILFTNSTIQQTERILDSLGVNDKRKCFYKIITLNDTRDPKPSKKSFDILVRALKGAKPVKVLYIGDSRKHDIIPAGKLGFNTIYINHWQSEDWGMFNYIDIGPLIFDLSRIEKKLRLLIK